MITFWIVVWVLASLFLYVAITQFVYLLFVEHDIGVEHFPAYLEMDDDTSLARVLSMFWPIAIPGAIAVFTGQKLYQNYKKSKG